MNGLENTLLVIIAIGSLTLIGFLLFAFDKTKAFRKEERQKFLATYPVACAGTPMGKTPRDVQSVSINNNIFKSKNGEILNPELYDQFIVRGNSMKFCRIYDNNLIFVKRINDHDGTFESNLPKVVVIKRTHRGKDECEYKIRRVWTKCYAKECLSKAEDIIHSPNFNVIKENSSYDGDEALLDDFKNIRLKKFSEDNNHHLDQEVIISTTFHTDTKKIRFSIHRKEDIVGEVTESFSV